MHGGDETKWQILTTQSTNLPKLFRGLFSSLKCETFLVSCYLTTKNPQKWVQFRQELSWAPNFLFTWALCIVGGASFGNGCDWSRNKAEQDTPPSWPITELQKRQCGKPEMTRTLKFMAEKLLVKVDTLAVFQRELQLQKWTCDTILVSNHDKTSQESKVSGEMTEMVFVFLIKIVYCEQVIIWLAFRFISYLIL